MWQINEVLKFDDQLYRILSVSSGEIVWICLDSELAQPIHKPEIELVAYMESDRLTRHTDPFQFLYDEEPTYNSVGFIKREASLALIKPIIVDELCFEPKIRARRIKMVSQTGAAAITTIYKALRRYWQRGQKPNALLPDYKNSGAPGQNRAANGTKKVGRSRQYGDGQGMKVTTEIERLFRVSIEKYLLSKNSLKVTVAYRRFSDLFEQFYPKASVVDRPTIRQFRYFYDREYKQPERLLTKNTSDVYNKDIRPLLSTVATHVLGPGSRYEIDATIADIYLVDNHDRSKIIGRPTVYVVVDVFSRMIVGFYFGFDNPSYVVAMQAVSNACIDKVAICARYGVEINTDDWPCIGLPDVIMADRGEMMSNQVESLISGFNVRIESAPPRRGDAKGVVENTFLTLQAEFKPYAPGVVQGKRIKKHGERDYRLDAVVSLNEFSEIILRTILFRNNYHVLDKYDRSEDLPTDVPSIPRELWKWGIQHRVGSLRQVDPDQLKIALLPRCKVSMSQFGAKVMELYYSSPEILKAGWLHRSPDIHRPQALEAAYNPDCADKVYLFPQAGNRVYWECKLTDRSRQFRGLTFWQVWDIQAAEKHNKANAKFNEDAKRRELDAFVLKTINTAIKKAPRPLESNNERIRQIKTNKKKALDVERRERTQLPDTISETRLAEVVPLKQQDDDYRLPSYVAKLFDGEEGS